jgi:hypothetical protein
MRHVVTGLFATRDQADHAIEALLGLGLDAARITLLEEPAQGLPAATDKAPGGEPGLPALLDALFLTEAERAAHRTALQRGQFVVTAEVEEHEADAVTEALDAAGALDLDEG